ncbi:3-methyl-2-oxobutanoate hydroxymethyltransferase [Diplonema papillatum]|nr:3-methyl-2-oxobutanoate hydroxymethyltransferase [Diplonema papillatum]
MGDAVSAICSTGVLVQGHIGLTPQTAAAMGGFRVQGKSVEAAKTLLEDAKALQKAGCFSIVIEGVPPQVAQYITQQLDIPTIGIGAGSHTSGQVLVLHDMIGLNPGRTPKFCKKYADVSGVIHKAVGDYCSDVRDGSFPGPDYSYSMPAEEAEKMVDVLSREVSFRSL